MPIYDYRCSACGHLTEVVHGIYDHGPKFCPECGAEGTMSKGVVAPAIHFKGSGWAKKDRSPSSAAATTAASESKEPTTAASADGASKDDSGKADGASTPAKSEPKPAASGGVAD